MQPLAQPESDGRSPTQLGLPRLTNRVHYETIAGEATSNDLLPCWNFFALSIANVYHCAQATESADACFRFSERLPTRRGRA